MYSNNYSLFHKFLVFFGVYFFFGRYASDNGVQRPFIPYLI